MMVVILIMMMTMMMIIFITIIIVYSPIESSCLCFCISCPAKHVQRGRCQQPRGHVAHHACAPGCFTVRANSCSVLFCWMSTMLVFHHAPGPRCFTVRANSKKMLRSVLLNVCNSISNTHHACAPACSWSRMLHCTCQLVLQPRKNYARGCVEDVKIATKKWKGCHSVKTLSLSL